MRGIESWVMEKLSEVEFKVEGDIEDYEEEA